MERVPLTERVDLILEKYGSDPFRRAKELKKLLREAEKASDVYAIGKIDLFLSICIFQQGRRDSILSYAYKAVSILENLDDYYLLARSYNLLGIAYAGLGNFQCALTAYHKALGVIRGRKKPGVRRQTLLNNIGDSYFQMGQFRKSLRIAMGCLASCRENNPENHTAMVLYGINIFDCNNSLGEYQKAKEILDDTRSDVECLGKSILVCGYYARLSCAHYSLGDLEGGTKYADVMLEMVHEHFDSYEFHHIFEKIVSFQIQNGDFKRARLISDALVRYAEKSGHTLDKIISKRVLASICCAVGDRGRALLLYKELNSLYEDRMAEQKAMQYESQQSVEAASKEITKLMNKIRISEEKAERDPLTGLMNRSALVSVTNEFIQNAREQGRNLGGVFLDIDYFKEYNDTYGHAAGDEAIKFIAGACMEEERSAVKFFRYGGDEYFGIVLGFENKQIEELALRISEKVRSSSFEHVKNPNGHRLTVSVGVVNVSVKDSNLSILDIIKYADQALYHAKDRGKDDVFAYQPLPDSQHEFRRIARDGDAPEPF